MPEVSVIVPVYKVEPYLRQCLDSVLAQTFTDFELILVDDGSPDGCGAICDEYAVRDNRIFVIHQVNAGQGKARNVGMDQAIGKYIIFLDSDDYWMPSTLETLYMEAERNQTQVLFFGAKQFWDGMKEPKYVNPCWMSPHAQNGVVKTGPESLKVSMDSREYHSFVWNRFYLLPYLRSNNLHFDEGIIHEEVCFSFFSYLFAERVECIGEHLYWYRNHPGSTMRSKSIHKSVHGYQKVLDSLLDVWLSHLHSEQEELLIERYYAKRIDMVLYLYMQALYKMDLKAARYVQKELGPHLRRARAFPNLPFSCRLTIFSLFLSAVVFAIKVMPRRLVVRMRSTDPVQPH